MGDNANTSYDSRDYGPVPLGLVQSRVLVKVKSTFKTNELNLFIKLFI